jgi:hypothetical protein
VCFLLEATAKIMESSIYPPQWSHSGVTKCTVEIFNVLSSDAPLELVILFVQSQGKSSILSLTDVPEILAIKVTSGLQQR